MKKDWSPDKIKYKLAELGLTMAAVARLHNCKENTVRHTILVPHSKGEALLAKTLDVPAYEIWPSRYDAGGNRYIPQPPENYIRLPRFRTSKKSSVA